MVLLRTIQSIWIYDYDQMFCSHFQLQYIIHLCIAPEYLIGESTAVPCLVYSIYGSVFITCDSWSVHSIITTTSVTFPVKHGRPDFTFPSVRRASGRRPRPHQSGRLGMEMHRTNQVGWYCDWIEWAIIVQIYWMGQCCIIVRSANIIIFHDTRTGCSVPVLCHIWYELKIALWQKNQICPNRKCYISFWSDFQGDSGSDHQNLKFTL